MDPQDRAALARMIDHTLLRPEATEAQIVALCAEAREHGFASVCVNSAFVALAATELADSGVAVCTTIGFPLGAASTRAKVAEAETALQDGATELDMVLAIGRLVADQLEMVEADIAAVAQAAHAAGARLKVILETALLSDAQIIAGAERALAANADFVKTSTGFGPGGATKEAVALLRKTVGTRAGVKASGGIRNTSDARVMISAGATRLGTSSGVAIVAGSQGAEGY